MCNAIREMCADARTEGQEDIILKLARKFSAEEIASMVEYSLDDIQRILTKYQPS